MVNLDLNAKYICDGKIYRILGIGRMQSLSDNFWVESVTYCRDEYGEIAEWLTISLKRFKQDFRNIED